MQSRDAQNACAVTTGVCCSAMSEENISMIMAQQRTGASDSDSDSSADSSSEGAWNKN